MNDVNDYGQRVYYEAASALRERQMQGKERMRKRLAALSEKIKILEKLRDREKAIAAAGLRRKSPKEGAQDRTVTTEE